jgi:hypothetical protein
MHTLVTAIGAVNTFIFLVLWLLAIRQWQRRGAAAASAGSGGGRPAWGGGAAPPRRDGSRSPSRCSG